MFSGDCKTVRMFKSLPNDKILDWSNLKAPADDCQGEHRRSFCDELCQLYDVIYDLYITSYSWQSTSQNECL